MEKIITNNYNLKEEDMNEVVKRVKILLINSKNQILLGYSNNEYQFPGGHVEIDEALIDGINREIEEETSIKLNITTIEPFACAMGYYKDWPKEGINRKIEIYYYEIKTDEKTNMSKTRLTEKEKSGNFELRYIDLDKVEEELINNSEKYGDPHGITKEMLELFKLYKANNKNDN